MLLRSVSLRIAKLYRGRLRRWVSFSYIENCALLCNNGGAKGAKEGIMEIKSDIEIAHEYKMEPIVGVANKLGLSESDLELFGSYKAKVVMSALRKLQNSPKRAKLVLVTAITPTPAGEGKSTISIGLADGLALVGRKVALALREPSLGPCFGVKGGACGGGKAQVVPMEDINLHFTGDIHAITAANNLMSALIDNSIQQGNPLRLDARTILWQRCLDLNDRALRNTIVGLGGKANGTPREEYFSISVASEVMAIICLSKSISELKKRLDAVTIGRDFDGRAVTFGELGCTGAVAALLKDALRPNLVQTLRGTPAFVHGGPFANIAHGCNSINATLCAMATSDYTVTEAGFASDLGAEKFMDIKCRMNGLTPSAVVIVASIRALKMHGGVPKGELKNENLDALTKGFCNLKAHVENIRAFRVPLVVAINRFVTDTDEEVAKLKSLCKTLGVSAIECNAWAEGASGARDLANKVIELSESENNFKPLYELNLPLKDKIELLAKKVYRAGAIEYSATAQKKLLEFQSTHGNLPVCIAKTQNSISDDPKLLGAPSGYTFTVRDAKLCSGAGFVVVYAGDIMTMPGLPKEPAALNIDVDDDGVVSGLF